MNPFSTNIASLQQESDDAIGIFKKTLNKLTGVNTKILAEQEKRTSKIEVLINENAALEKVAQSNNKYIAKINEFLT